MSTRPQGSAAIRRTLVPEFDTSNTLLECDPRGLEDAIRHLVFVSETMALQRYSHAESRVALYLRDFEQAANELVAASYSDLLEYWSAPPRDMSKLVKSSKTDEALGVVKKLPCLDADAFITLVRILSSGAEPGYRNCAAATQPDARGRFVVYPSASTSVERMKLVAAVLSRLKKGESVRSAVWILVATLNAHAFADGNGRLARLLWQLAVSRLSGLPAQLFPIGPLIYASGGAFEIAVRRVEVQGVWQPIVDLLAVYSKFLGKHIQTALQPASDEMHVERST
jgi:hypothetical protein